MRKNKTVFLMLGIGIMVLAIASCNSEKKSETTDSPAVDSTIVAVDSSANLTSEEFVIPDTTVLIEQSNEEMENVKASNKTILFSKGAVWKMWQKIFKEQFRNEHFKTADYLGIHNTLDIGTVFNSNGEPLWALDDLTTEAERKRFTKADDGTPINKIEKSAVSFESAFEITLPSSGIEGELSSALKNQKSLTVKINNARIKKLISGPLRLLLKNPQDEALIEYKNSIYNENNQIISQAVIINGFSLTIALDKDISASLKASLEKGIVKEVGKAGTKLKFEYKSANEISVTSSGSFIAFVDIVNSLKLMQSTEGQK
jgi:hypothetical protein